MKLHWNTLLRRIFIAAMVCLIGYNGFRLYSHDSRQIWNYKKILDHQLVGHRFSGLEEFLKGIEYVGYITDEDISQADVNKHFAQAQFRVAPTILDPGNYDREYVLFVCKDEQFAWAKMKEFNLEPLRRNKFGIILARHR